ARAAVLGGRGQAQIAAFAQLVPQLERHAVLALDQLGPALAFVLHVGANFRVQCVEFDWSSGGHVVTSSRAWARRTNFWILPDGVRGSVSTSSRRSGQ